ncbi:MAG: hypothetical protein IPN76_26160 [Saprospiraceae bacterium]|nr:hypothetical protein [Saprospiraceae bacterium]
MTQAAKLPHHVYPAHLYDGERQLPGTLELCEQQLVFRLVKCNIPFRLASCHLPFIGWNSSPSRAMPGGKK